MYLAVKFWKDFPDRPSNVPDYWPAEVKELGNSRQLPGPEWVLMTKDDLCTYKHAHQEEYDKWRRDHPFPPGESGDPDAPPPEPEE